MALLLSLRIGLVSHVLCERLRNTTNGPTHSNQHQPGGHAGAFAGVDAGLGGPVSGSTVVEGLSAGELSPSAHMRDRLREVVRRRAWCACIGQCGGEQCQVAMMILDSGSQEPRKANVCADRDYFLAFKGAGHEGLFVGRPGTLPHYRGRCCRPGARLSTPGRVWRHCAGRGAAEPLQRTVSPRWDLGENSGVICSVTMVSSFALPGMVTRTWARTCGHA